jgi:hypothetical protein
MMFSADYATNTNVLPNINSGIRQPSFSPSVSFFSKPGIDAMITGNLINNSNDSLNNFASELDLFIGYNFKPFKNFTIYPNYTHYWYSRNFNEFSSPFSDELRIDMDYQKKTAGIGLSSGFLYGKHNTFYTVARNYYTVEFRNVIFKTSAIMLQPEVDVNAGNYEYLNLFYLDQLRESPSFYNYMLYSSRPLRRYVLAELFRHPGTTKEQIIDALLEKNAEDSFKITSVTFSLPIFYTIGNFGINAGLFLFIPINQPDYLSNDALLYFDVGVSYSFGW